MNYPYLRRMGAFLVDWYLSTLLAMVPVVVFQSVNGQDLVIENSLAGLSTGQAVAATILALALYTVYFCVLPLRAHGGFRAGQTPGRRLFGLALTGPDSGAPGFGRLFLRDFVGVLLLQGNLTSVNIYLMSLAFTVTGVSVVPYFHSLFYLCIIASLVLVLTRRKQTLHDLISGTRVSLAPQREPAGGARSPAAG